MGFFSGVRRRIKKLIPKEVRPFIPYAAAMIPGMGPFAAMATKNPMMYKAIMAGGSKFLSDDEAGIKDVLRTSAFAAAPDALNKFGGPTGPYDKGIMGTLRKGAATIGQKAAASPYKTAAALGSVDAGIKAAELNEDALERYNREMAERGITDRKDRRARIQGTQQSEMISQRKNDTPPKDFEQQEIGMDDFMPK